MLGKLIHAYRTQEHISTRKLARVIGIDHTGLWRFERGKEIECSNWIRIMIWALTGDEPKPKE